MTNRLFEAIEQHDIKRLEEELKAGSDPNAVEKSYPKYTALQAAINEIEDGGPIGALTLLLRHGAEINAWDGYHDGTPLLMAVFRNQFDAVRLLLEAGADPNVRGSEGDSPLRWCAEKNDLPMAEILIQYGAKKTIDEAGGEYGCTALGSACRNLTLPMVLLLLKAGASPNGIDQNLLKPLELLPEETKSNAQVVRQIRELLQGG